MQILKRKHKCQSAESIKKRFSLVSDLGNTWIPATIQHTHKFLLSPLNRHTHTHTHPPLSHIYPALFQLWQSSVGDSWPCCFPHPKFVFLKFFCWHARSHWGRQLQHLIGKKKYSSRDHLCCWRKNDQQRVLLQFGSCALSPPCTTLSSPTVHCSRNLHSPGSFWKPRQIAQGCLRSSCTQF